MADGDIALEAQQFFLVKNVRNQPHIRVYIDLPALGRSYARAFLSAVLKGIQRKESDAGYIYSGGVNTENAAAFVQIVHRITRGLYVFYSGTVNVITAVLKSAPLYASQFLQPRHHRPDGPLVLPQPVTCAGKNNLFLGLAGLGVQALNMFNRHNVVTFAVHEQQWTWCYFADIFYRRNCFKPFEPFLRSKGENRHP